MTLKIGNDGGFAQVHLFLFRGGLFRDGPKHGICRSM